MNSSQSSSPGIGHTPFVSVVIPVFNEAHLLRKCLQCLQGQTYKSDKFEVLVCDNGSTDDISSVRDEFAFATFVSELKSGPAAARNTALTHAKGDIVAFTDADCLPRNDWIEQGVQYMSTNPNYSLVGGNIEMITSPNGRLSVMETFDCITKFRQEWFVQFYDFSVTANLFTYKSVVDSLHGFDVEHFPFAGEDCDFCLRAKLMDYRIGYSPSTVIHHPAQTSLGTHLRKYIAMSVSEMKLKHRFGSFGKKRHLTERLFADGARLRIILDGTRGKSLRIKIGCVVIYVLENCIRFYTRARYSRTNAVRNASLIEEA